ncbi:MAG TPA: RTX toxin [Thermoanaerobaculia bacterium]|nr:RTX toxin [Thermoanaerobaculia bacterium]
MRLKQPLSPGPHLSLPPAASPLVPRCLFGAVLLLALLAVALPLTAADTADAANAADAANTVGKLVGLGGVWVANGPAPTTDDLVHVAPDNSVDGAVHVVIPHPTLPDVLYAGAVNGGVWVTTNATAVKPTWRPLTDSQTSQSIGALAFDPTDSSFRTLVAGPGLYSSFGDNGDLAGLLRTTDGGATWKRLTGNGLMLRKSFSAIAPRGRTLVTAVSSSLPFNLGAVGIFRSTNTGSSFVRISRGNGTATGLPAGVAYGMSGDPVLPNRLFTSIVQAEVSGGKNGLYRSDDTGATWTKVSPPAVDVFLVSGKTDNVRFAVGRQNNVYVAIVNDFQLAAVFRSGDGGTSWVKMDLPQTVELFETFGIHPGHQGDFNTSLVADPANANLVYIGGDRQPSANEGDPNATRNKFPNSIGSTGFWGRLFRGDASKPAGSQWVHLTHSNTLGPPGGGTASGSAPHVDSRLLVFDAAGNLIESDDGGVYKRTSPQSNTGDWFALNGNLQVAEIKDATLDHVNGFMLAGAQDTDAIVQNTPGSLDWGLLLYGDGGDVNIDETGTPGMSLRYHSVQFLRNLSRSSWDNVGNFLGFDRLALTVLDGGAALVAQFLTPVRLDGGDPMRLVLGAENGVYESMDRGDTLTEIGPGIEINSLGREALAYGIPGSPNVLYVGGSDDPHVFPGTKLWVRTAAPPAPLVRSLTFPGTSPISAIAIDPHNANHAVVTTADTVYQTTNAGATWSNVTGNLNRFDPSLLRSVAFVPNAHSDGLVVGTNRGAYLATAREGFVDWSRLGHLLPTAPVLSLRYDPAADSVIAGLLGRGIWTLKNIDFAIRQAD